MGDYCDKGHQLHPHVVWFGEEVPMIRKAMSICQMADILMIVGTSMQVYPAASLIHYIKEQAPVYFIDPNPNISGHSRVTVIPEPATSGIEKVISRFL
ncbi:Sir2 family NAD-dependent protein deacetylase [Gaetbulibacter sp. M240]|uniref:Sir2 family NAD-dependent protein deacetylase n=1 Tax=Gaetbulibacter sp. M240 TaxID=3126511 RepID=UPI00374F82C1